MPLSYNEDWVHPARTVEQARCKGINCTPDMVPGRLVMAVTLSVDGLCVNCARTADDEHTKLWIGDEA